MLKKFTYRAIGKIIRLRDRVLKPFSIGVRAIVVSGGEVLLVQHRYGATWYLPGGGVNKREHLVDALLRELSEEVGLKPNVTPVLFSTYANFFETKSDFISVFKVENFTMLPQENLEIGAYKFFNIDALPETTSPGTRRRLMEYSGQKSIDYKW